MVSIPSTSLEYVKVKVLAIGGGDPTAALPQFAFLAGDNDPNESDWVAGEWVEGSTYEARLLVGPGAHELGEGVYTHWLRITDTPERPVLKVGTVTIT